jgi:hypothetical protein
VSLKFRVRAYGDGNNQPFVDLEYQDGIPVRWSSLTSSLTIGLKTIMIAIDPVETAPSFIVCEAPAMGGSPLCDLPKGHDGIHAYSEVDGSGKKHTYSWGKGAEKEDTEARLKRAIQVLHYVAEVYRSPLVREALKELTAEEFVP